jgi:hypothetical protein
MALPSCFEDNFFRLQELQLDTHFQKTKALLSTISKPTLPSASSLCMVGIARVPEKCYSKITPVLNELSSADPLHLFYSVSQLHTTLHDIVPLSDGDPLTKIPAAVVEKMYRDVLPHHFPMLVSLHGLNITQKSVFAQVLFEKPLWSLLRNDLKQSLAGAGYSVAIDYTHRPQTDAGWVTLARFRNANVRPLVEVVEKYRHHSFGSFTVDALELVVTDPYFSLDKIKSFGSFKLRKLE